MFPVRPKILYKPIRINKLSKRQLFRSYNEYYAWIVSNCNRVYSQERNSIECKCSNLIGWRSNKINIFAAILNFQIYWFSNFERGRPNDILIYFLKKKTLQGSFLLNYMRYRPGIGLNRFLIKFCFFYCMIWPVTLSVFF